MSKFNNIFDKEGNLTMESRILYAYAMHLQRVGDLPPVLVEHFWSNTESRRQIMELYELYDAEMIAQNPHPYFEAKTATEMHDGRRFDWENMEEALEDILRVALAEESQLNRALERKMAASFKTSAAAIEVAIPKKDAVCIQNIPFVFEQALAAAADLHFKNAQGMTIGRFKIAEGSTFFQVSIEDSQRFPSGLYYWTLLVGNTPITNRLYVCTEEDARSIVGDEPR